MKAVRRWFIYRRLLNELADSQNGAHDELGLPRQALNDFAWHCARVEAEGTSTSTLIELRIDRRRQ